MIYNSMANKYFKTFEEFSNGVSKYLYHYTTLNALQSIVTNGYIQGYAGSIYDEEDGETISTTSDSEYHTKGHDIKCECKITLNAVEIRKHYKVHQEEDYGYTQMRIASLMKSGMSKDKAEEYAHEHQEIIMIDKLPIDYITHVHFFIKPGEELISLLKTNNIDFSI